MQLASTLSHLSPSTVDVWVHQVPERRVAGAVDLRVADELETAFQRGCEGALKDAYDAHGGLVYTYCKRSLGTDPARDTTQVVFLAAWKAHHRYDPSRGSLAGWLMGITKNKVIDQLRASGRGVDAINTLPARARTVVEMAFFDDHTHGEIAEKTQLPLGTVKSDIRRGLLKMRGHMEASS